jgi:hypothetical protein
MLLLSNGPRRRGHTVVGGPRHRGRAVVGRRGEESGVGRPGARGRASWIWGHGMEGGDDGVEGAGGAEGGQPNGAKANFTAIRVSHRRGYSSYTWYIIGIG